MVNAPLQVSGRGSAVRTPPPPTASRSSALCRCRSCLGSGGGRVALTDPLEKHLGWDVKVPTREGKAVRLIDLATHAGGFPREVPHESGPPNDPFANITKQAFVAFLKGNDLLFAPGTGALYSNMGFDLLAAALAGAASKPYPDLLREHITQPLGMADTVFSLDDEQRGRLMQ